MAWRIAAATSIGTSHLATMKPCQDNLGIALVDSNEGKVFVGVVCDGAGSALYSDVGSLAVVSSLTRSVEAYFEGARLLSEIDRDCVIGWLNEARTAVASLAADACCSVREYACTLLVSIVGPESAVFFQVGDGAIVVSEGGEDGWSYVFWPQHGEFANSTNFVISQNAIDVLEFGSVARTITDIAMFSDGLENLVLHTATKSVHEPFFHSMIDPVRGLINPGLSEKLSESLASYLASPAICERTDDDKSLILATRYFALVDCSDECPAS